MSLRIPVKFLSIGKFFCEFIIDLQGRARNRLVGGPCLYTAAVMNYWGNQVGVAGLIGRDFPEGWQNKLNSLKIDSRGILYQDDYPDSRKFYAYSSPSINTQENPVAIYASRGLTFPRELLGYSQQQCEENWERSAQFTSRLVEHLPADYMDASAAHLSPLDLTSHIQLTTKLFKGAIRTLTVQSHPSYMIPSHWEDIHLVVKDITAFITTTGELQNLFQGRSQDTWDMMKGISQFGCAFVIARDNGQKWLLYDSRKSSRYMIPDYPARVVDPTGCTDAFCGGFLSQLMETHDPLQSAIMGAVAVSLKVEGTGPFAINDCLPGLDQNRCKTIKEMVIKY